MKWIVINSEKDFPKKGGYYHVRIGIDKTCWGANKIIERFEEGLPHGKFIEWLDESEGEQDHTLSGIKLEKTEGLRPIGYNPSDRLLNEDNTIQSGGEIAEPVKGLGTCISCGSPTDKWNVCDNCWDEVPKHLKKQLTDNTLNEDWERFVITKLWGFGEDQKAKDLSIVLQSNLNDITHAIEHFVAPLLLQVQELKERNKELENVIRGSNGSIGKMFKENEELQSKISSLELQLQEKLYTWIERLENTDKSKNDNLFITVEEEMKQFLQSIQNTTT